MTKRTRGRKWMALRDRALAKTQYRCAECLRNGRLASAKQVDHIIPLHQVGLDDHYNLDAVSRPLHDASTSR